MRLSVDLKELKALAAKLEDAEKNGLKSEIRRAVNRVADRHLARCVENTDVGDSPDSPDLRNRWERTSTTFTGKEAGAEVFNPLEYASHYEFGHKQTPGRIVFIELRAGARKYGQTAKKLKSGRWGIFVRLKKSFVKGKYVMTTSEARAQKELDMAGAKIIEGLIGG